MRNTWRQLFRRLAAGCVVSASMAWTSALCYAAAAYDDASDPAYADGWQGRVVNAAGAVVNPIGDSGGFGFTQWDFTSLLTFGGNRYDYTSTNFHAIDDGLRNGTHYSNPHNNIGRAWDIGSTNTPNNGVPRAGRGFSLAVGETLKVVFDNPTRRQFFKGYQINLNSSIGGVNGNMCYQGVECVAGSGAVRKLSLNTFEYFTYGEWGLNGAAEGLIDVLDTDTASAGAVFTVERTGTETYVATLNSSDPLKMDFGPASGSFSSPGAEVNWIEFTFFNGITDLTPTLGEPGTDFFIRSMEIISPVPPGQPGDFNEDGEVDAADYVMWRKNNNGNTALPNDDGLGTPINQNHYNLWKQNFGEGSGAGGVGAVPEPNTFVSLIVATAGLFLGTSWRQNIIDGNRNRNRRRNGHGRRQRRHRPSF